MSDYRFDLFHDKLNLPTDGPIGDAATQLGRRPGLATGVGEAAEKNDASLFQPPEGLNDAINTAVALNMPLLLTGEPGTGKTQTAYYIAHALGLDVLRFQVKSETSGGTLLYEFDNIAYMRDAFVARENAIQSDGPAAPTDTPDMMQYIRKGALWKAYESEAPVVLLIDEIDKAPRDFPNDLLRELDRSTFDVPELDTTIGVGSAGSAPILVITSNSERRLPDAFLRRCVFHHLEFNKAILEKAVNARITAKLLHESTRNLVPIAIEKFMEQREKTAKPPSTAEFLVWMKVLELNNVTAQNLETETPLPFQNTLIKQRSDQNIVSES